MQGVFLFLPVLILFSCHRYPAKREHEATSGQGLPLQIRGIISTCSALISIRGGEILFSDLGYFIGRVVPRFFRVAIHVKVDSH